MLKRQLSSYPQQLKFWRLDAQLAFGRYLNDATYHMPNFDQLPSKHIAEVYSWLVESLQNDSARSQTVTAKLAQLVYSYLGGEDDVDWLSVKSSQRPSTAALLKLIELWDKPETMYLVRQAAAEWSTELAELDS